MLRAYARPAAPIILAQSNAAASVTGTTTETTLASVTLPGGMMGANGALRITPLWSVTNSANTKTLRVKVGASTVVAVPLTTSTTIQFASLLRNANLQAAQKTFTVASTSGTGTSGSGVSTFAIDTSTDQTIAFTGQLGTASETITLEAFLIEVLPG